MHCRVLPHCLADGPGNMAVDDWLLATIAAAPSTAAFRTYEWSPPTLSLGYFQSIADAETDPLWKQRPIVRRPTGGGAIWHDRELTYALVLPRTHPLARRAADTYRAVHEAIDGLLIELGIPAQRRGEADARRGRDRPFLCFQDRDAEDLVVSGSKILGSAQRRRSGALLQHGSLMLGRSDSTPELPGLLNLAPKANLPDHPAAWSELVGERLLATLGLDGHIQPLTAAEHTEIALLESSTYRNLVWNRRR